GAALRQCPAPGLLPDRVRHELPARAPHDHSRSGGAQRERYVQDQRSPHITGGGSRYFPPSWWRLSNMRTPRCPKLPDGTGGIFSSSFMMARFQVRAVFEGPVSDVAPMARRAPAFLRAARK